MMTPTIFHRSNGIRCEFYRSDLNFSFTPKLSDFVINSMPTGKSFYDSGRFRAHKGFVAVQFRDTWSVKGGEVLFGRTYVEVTCDEKIHFENCAFPIDPRMTKADIEGATRIYKNSDNTGWLFAHALIKEHHDRELIAESIVTSLFDDVMNDSYITGMSAVIGGLSTSRQRGEAQRWVLLSEFRKDTKNHVRHSERAKHIGQHVQDDYESHYLHQMVLNSLNETIRFWKADTTKASQYQYIQNEVKTVVDRLTGLHGYETRWDKAARLKKEAAAANPTGNPA